MSFVFFVFLLQLEKVIELRFEKNEVNRQFSLKTWIKFEILKGLLRDKLTAYFEWNVHTSSSLSIVD